MVLILGAKSSGKSVFARQICEQRKKDKILYIATLRDINEYTHKKISVHQKKRKDFYKLFELDTQIKEAKGQVKKGDIVLLESLDSLVENELFSKNSAKSIVKKIVKGLKSIDKKAKGELFIVSWDLGMASCMCYDSVTGEYVKMLCELNREVSKAAQSVVEVVYSLPVLRKGSL